jgi:hypothetical protein
MTTSANRAMNALMSRIMRDQISDILDEIRLAHLNVDELQQLFDILTAARRRVRERPKLSVVATDEINGREANA